MKNPLLESLITDILFLTEKRVARNVGDVWQSPKTKKWTAKRADRTQPGFDSEEAARRWLSGAEPEPAAQKQPGTGGAPAAEPTAAYAKPSEPKAADAGGVQVNPSDLTARIKRTKDPKRREVLERLEDALQSGDPAQVQKVIEDYGLFISPEGKLKSTKLGMKVSGDDKEFARYLYDLAKQAGVDIPGAGGKEDNEEEQPSKDTEQYKPNQIFQNDPMDQLDVEITSTGITVEGEEVSRIDGPQAEQMEQDVVDRARKRLEEQGKELTPDQETKLRRYVQARIAETNHNIEYLGRLAQSGEGLRARQFQGDEGRQLISQRLTESVDRNIPDPEKRREASEAIQAMAAARTPREFNAAYQRFRKAIKGTPMEAGKKYIAETLTALRAVAMGGTALIPDSDSFELADVISIRRSPLTGEINIDQILVDVDEEAEYTAAGSVKQGRGAASGNKPKIENSRFNTGEVDGVDCSSVQDDLLGLCDMRRNIFQPTEDGDVTPEVKEEIMGTIRTYGPMIRAYYGLPEDMSDEELYEFLSYGKELACVDGQPQPTPDGMEGEPYKQAQSANGGQWRAWSVVGKITDAIHNRTVQQQYYHTVRYNGGITVADGIRSFSRMQSQHLKNKAKVPGAPDGYSRPDQELNAYTIPCTEEELRNGNPCTQ